MPWRHLAHNVSGRLNDGAIEKGDALGLPKPPRPWKLTKICNSLLSLQKAEAIFFSFLKIQQQC